MWDGTGRPGPIDTGRPGPMDTGRPGVGIVSDTLNETISTTKRANGKVSGKIYKSNDMTNGAGQPVSVPGALVSCWSTSAGGWRNNRWLLLNNGNRCCCGSWGDSCDRYVSCYSVPMEYCPVFTATNNDCVRHWPQVDDRIVLRDQPY